MKKKLSALLLGSAFLSFGSTAFAAESAALEFDASDLSTEETLGGWVYVAPWVQVSPLQVVAQITNRSGVPVFCRGRAFGTLANGFTLQSFVGPAWVPPGGYMYTTVYTNPAAPFVNGWGEFFCTVY